MAQEYIDDDLWPPRMQEQALIEMAKLLPPPGSVFPLRRQLAWLRAFHVAASFAYGFDPDDIEIVIEPDPDWGRDRIVVRPNLKRVAFRPNDHGVPCQGCPGRYPVPAVAVDHPPRDPLAEG